ncbi:hypothetical protein [Pseudonocardia alaniniphila]|uniref:Uncharacterized protein n=1 Tax=Pseudonocardia alaniniphila TaxID=75291 RepID=A0ABS9TMW5_9PSEU|nr:hypothetical protein [Pseudonocardia alaniniphila]MCH6169876.1 hypothetical protein [Pseudonocardia alaniniphila]
MSPRIAARAVERGVGTAGRDHAACRQGLPGAPTASRVKTAHIAGFPERHHYAGRVPAQVFAERMRARLPSVSPGTVADKSFSDRSFTRLLHLPDAPLADYDDAITAALAVTRTHRSSPALAPS